MKNNEFNDQEYFERFNNPVTKSREDESQAGKTMVTGSTERSGAELYGMLSITEKPPEMPSASKKKRRPVLKAIAAAVCCMALMLGSGLAGAKITEGRFNALSDNGSVAQNQNADIFGSGNGSAADPLGSVNPGGGTLSLTELFAGANSAVVAISTEMTGRNVFGRTVTLPAAGSGFIISEDGYIVTNNHVIENASSISVLLHDGTEYPATLVGRDPESDLAVLKIDAKDLSYLSWGNSGALQVGEQVAAIGNPLGEFANSMTVGYISALDREINIDGVPRNMLQTDAAVNEGNSGGPLLNMSGQVIGIVSAKSGGTGVEGLGFAIPSSKASEITGQLIQNGYVKGRAVMGVQVGTGYDNSGKQMVYVESVNAGSAAEAAGVKAGDVILSANGAVVSTVDALKGIIGSLSPGDKLTLKVLRGGVEVSLTVTLDEYRPADNMSPAPDQTPNQQQGLPLDPRSMLPGIGSMFPQDGNSGDAA